MQKDKLQKRINKLNAVKHSIDILENLISKNSKGSDDINNSIKSRFENFDEIEVIINGTSYYFGTDYFGDFFGLLENQCSDFIYTQEALKDLYEEL